MALEKNEAILTWKVAHDMLFSEINRLQSITVTSPFVLKNANRIY